VSLALLARQRAAAAPDDSELRPTRHVVLG